MVWKGFKKKVTIRLTEEEKKCYCNAGKKRKIKVSKILWQNNASTKPTKYRRLKTTISGRFKRQLQKEEEIQSIQLIDQSQSITQWAK